MTREIEQQVYRIIKIWRSQRVQRTEADEDIISRELSVELEELDAKFKAEDARRAQVRTKNGRKVGRPRIDGLPSAEQLKKRLAGGLSQIRLAEELQISIPTLIKRIKKG